MKSKSTKTKLLTVLLAICMVFSLVQIIAFATESTAVTATETADFTADDGGAAALALLNNAKTGSANSSWDKSSKTLTLRGIDFATSATTALKMPTGSTIILADGTENAIKSGDATANASGGYKSDIFITALDAVGDLTIQGGMAGTGTLSVTSGSHNNSGDAWTYSSAITVDGDFTVKGGHITVQGGQASTVGEDGLAFSIGVNMESDKKNKFLQVRGGTLTAIGGESYHINHTEGNDTDMGFSRGVYMYNGSVSVTGDGKLTAQIVPTMNDSGLATGLYISIGDLLISNEGEAFAAGHDGVNISGGGISITGGKLTAMHTKMSDNDYGHAISVSKEFSNSSSGNNTKLSGNIEVSGGALETVNDGIYMYTYNPTDEQGLFNVSGGGVNLAGGLFGARKINISGGTVQTQYIHSDELTLSNATLTVREPVKKFVRTDGSYILFASPALWLENLTVNSGTLDAAWDWGEYTPFVFSVDEEYGFRTPLVRMWGDDYVATFNGGTTIFDTGCAGNLVMKLGRIVLGDGMAETGADSNQYQLSSDTPVRFSAGKAVNNISEAVISDVKFDYQPADAPRKSASISLPGDPDKYEIEYEYWEEMQKGENGSMNPVAFWYSDESKNNALASDKRITAFEEGKTYMYSIMLKAKDGYAFSDNCSVMINNTLIKSENVIKSENGLFVIAVKTITPRNTVQQKEIQLIEIANATVSFKDGDKPTFTGTTPDGAEYVMVYEAWKTDGAGISSDEFFNDDEHLSIWGGKLITAFDKSKTYTYMLYLKTTSEAGQDGWVFGPNTKLMINGEEVAFTRDSSDEEYGQTFTVKTALTMVPQSSGTTPDYKIIEGANGIWTQGSDSTLTFRSNGDFAKLTGIRIDGEMIAADKYIAISDSSSVILKADYLDTLSVGGHTLTIVYSDGECEADFEVKAAQSSSGDTSDRPNDPVQTTDASSDGSQTTDAPSSESQTAETSGGGDQTTDRSNDVSTNPDKAPQTGDSSHLALWIALFFGCGALICIIAFFEKRKDTVR